MSSLWLIRYQRTVDTLKRVLYHIQLQGLRLHSQSRKSNFMLMKDINVGRMMNINKLLFEWHKTFSAHFYTVIGKSAILALTNQFQYITLLLQNLSTLILKLWFIFSGLYSPKGVYCDWVAIIQYLLWFVVSCLWSWLFCSGCSLQP